MQKEVVIFIDTIASKNKIQVDAIHQLKMNVTFFVTSSQSNNILGSDDAEFLLSNNFFKRLYQVFSYFKSNRNKIHHAEVYPGGRFSFIVVLLSKVFSIKCICVERGDLLYFNKMGYHWLTRFSMWICYKKANIVWYKEPYMESMLQKIGVKKIFFLHNAINTENVGKHQQIPFSEKDIDFLWLNRIIPQRKADWFVEILAKPTFEKSKNYLIGILPNSIYKKEQEFLLELKPNNLNIIDYTNKTEQYFKRAKYFVLAADIIFANNALLEAMYYGVVPIISYQQGAEIIVQHGKNGLVFNNTKADLETAMASTLSITPETYSLYSTAAQSTIENDFSSEKYSVSLNKLYNLL